MRLRAAAYVLFILAAVFLFFSVILFNDMMHHDPDLFSHYRHYCNQMLPFTITAILAVFCAVLGFFILMKK